MMGAAETFVVCPWSHCTMMKLRFRLASLILIHTPNPIFKIKKYIQKGSENSLSYHQAYS